MNPIIKAKWVEALRSGEYKQGQAALRHADHFCCLGVLCDLHSKETGYKWTRPSNSDPDTDVMYYQGQSGMPPEVVTEWAELVDMNVLIAGEVQSLDGHNDAGVKFDQIAKAIEEQL